MFAFFYAGLHLAVDLFLDVGLEGQALRADLLERPFVAFGMTAFLLLLPLAATSNRTAIRRLGAHWRRLHMLCYAIAVLALVHFWWQVKAGHDKPWSYVLVLALLLAARLLAWCLGDRHAGAEVTER